MAISIFDATIPVLIRGLGILEEYLDRAAAFDADYKIDPKVLVNARLATDMLPLAGQIQRASDTFKGAFPRLTDLQAPSFADTDTTLEELKKRIADTVAFLESVSPENLQGAEQRKVELKNLNSVLTGDVFVLQFLLPNFFFHVATAHDILRHNG